MGLIAKVFSKSSSSGNVAKKRLRRVLSNDRTVVPPPHSLRQPSMVHRALPAPGIRNKA